MVNPKFEREDNFEFESDLNLLGHFKVKQIY